ncbi:MAG: HIT domain-containing protein, partial [Anaerolineaceae bacterium]|nr:HIT domain-containing protein [Anaerolineaceae bacterium]
MEYIMEHTPSKECIFCAALTGSNDAASLLLYRGERAFIILNLFPYTSGHLMVVPNAHVPFLDELDSETRLELIELT